MSADPRAGYRPKTAAMIPGNCVLGAVVAWLRNPRTTSIRFVRNKGRRWHCIWERDGKRFEFYAAGRSRLPYWRNALYLGQAREIGGVKP